MTRTILFAAGLAIAGSLAASTAVFAQPMLDEITVDAEFEDVEGANALQYWPELENDLAEAIAYRAGSMRSENGYDVTVRVREITMSGSRVLTGEGEFNHLEGIVYFRAPDDPVPVEQVTIILDARTGEIPVLEDGAIVVLPGTPVFYAALLDAFARNTIEALGKLDPIDGTPTPGNKNEKSS